MDAVIIVDMQAGLLDGPPKHDLAGVVGRINRLTDAVRRRAGKVVWIRHCGAPGDGFERHSEGWSFLPELNQHTDDLVIEKTLNDAFAGTALQETLERIAPDRLLVCGWATDFCVDTTVRSAVSRGHRVIVVGNGHTLADRPHLRAPEIIRHHHYVWTNLIAEVPVQVAMADDLI